MRNLLRDADRERTLVIVVLAVALGCVGVVLVGAALLLTAIVTAGLPTDLTVIAAAPVGLTTAWLLLTSARTAGALLRGQSRE